MKYLQHYRMNKSLPSHIIKALPFDAQTIFRHAINNAFSQKVDGFIAFKIGLDAVRKAGYKKESLDKWVYVENSEPVEVKQEYDWYKPMTDDRRAKQGMKHIYKDKQVGTDNASQTC